MMRFFTLVALVWLVSPPALSEPRIGINGAACTYETLSEAIEAAAPEDTLFVSSGTYAEQPGLIDKSLTLRAAQDDCASPGNQPVVVDGEENLGGVFVVDTPGSRPIDVTFERFRLINGADKFGGLLRIGNATVVMERGALIDGDASNDGGCAHVVGGTLTLTDSDVSGCTAIRDGGAISVSDGSLVLTGADLTFNSAGRSGGAVSIASTKPSPKTLEIRSSTFTDNQSSLNGGAIEFVGSDLAVDDLRVSDSTFENNVTGEAGGALYSAEFSELRIADSLFDGNSTLSDDLSRGGGAIYLQSGDVFNLGGTELLDNVAGNIGGGLAAFHVRRMDVVDGEVRANRANQGGGMFVFSADDFELRRVVVAENAVLESFDGLGGGIAVIGGTTRCLGSTLQQNEAGAGAAIHAELANVSVENCRLIDNGAYYFGGGIAAYGSTVVVRAVVTGTTACDARNLAPNTYCSEFRGNAASEGGLGGALYVARSSISGGASDVVVERTAIIDNYADFSGSAIQVDGENADGDDERNALTLRNVLIQDNGTMGPSIANVYVGELADVVLDSVTAAANFGPALVAEGPDATVALNNTIFWDNTVPPSASLTGTTVEAECAYSESEAAGSWNLGTAVDPQFVADAERGDLRLDPMTSPLRDVCASGPMDDLDGGRRPGAGAWDAGAFESSAGPPNLVFADDFGE